MNLFSRIKTSKRKRSIDEDPIGYLLIAPFMIATFVFVILPILANIYLSFTDYNIKKMNFVGLKNYIFLFKDELLWISLKNTLVFTSFTLIANMVLGLVMALFLKTKIFGLKFFRTGLYTPYVTSMVGVSMIWLWIYDPTNGMFNQILAAFNLPARNWLFDVKTAMGCIITVSIWKSVGYYMTIYISGLHSIPKYLYEAAQIDGATVLKRFWYITVPMLMPVTFFLFITGFMNNFKVFEQVMIMTSGGPMNSTTTIVHQIYSRAFNDSALGYAAAQAVLLLVIVSIVTLINFKYGNQGNDLEAS